MKIKLIEAVKLYEALATMSDKEVPFSTAHTLVLTKNELKPHVEFYAEKEFGIISEYAEKDADGNLVDEGNGRFRIPAKNAREAQDKRSELNAIEVEITKRKIKTMPENITLSNIEALMLGFELPEEEQDE